MSDDLRASVLGARYEAVVQHGAEKDMISTVPPMTGEALRDRLVKDVESLIRNAYQVGTTTVRISVTVVK